MSTELRQLRAEIDRFMKYHPQSPLPAEERPEFQGLPYYEHNPSLVFELPLESLPNSEPPISMETSSGDLRLYHKLGRVTFDVNRQPATLTIYCDPYGEDWFLPFKDATNKTETYGAGRYLDNHRPGLRRLDDQTIELDFNFAYNPYCAYNPHYSCPLPPRENWLAVEITAGEKKFKADY